MRSRILSRGLVVIVALCIIIPLAHWWRLSSDKKRLQITIGEMRSLATALSEYSIYHGRKLPQPAVLLRSPLRSGPRLLPPRAWPPSMAQQVRFLAPYLAPEYITELPTSDGWGYPLLCVISDDGMSYSVTSVGKDGKLDATHSRTWPPREFDRDVILADGEFVSFPYGLSN